MHGLYCRPICIINRLLGLFDLRGWAIRCGPGNGVRQLRSGNVPKSHRICKLRGMFACPYHRPNKLLSRRPVFVGRQLFELRCWVIFFVGNGQLYCVRCRDVPIKHRRNGVCELRGGYLPVCYRNDCLCGMHPRNSHRRYELCLLRGPVQGHHRRHNLHQLRYRNLLIERRDRLHQLQWRLLPIVNRSTELHQVCGGNIPVPNGANQLLCVRGAENEHGWSDELRILCVWGLRVGWNMHGLRCWQNVLRGLSQLHYMRWRHLRAHGLYPGLLHALPRRHLLDHHRRHCLDHLHDLCGRHHLGAG